MTTGEGESIQQQAAAAFTPFTDSIRELSPTERLELFGDYFQETTTVGLHLETMGEYTAAEIARHMAPPNETKPITPQIFANAIDFSKPTLGLRFSTVAGAGLLAVAAQQLRAKGEDICNVVILPHTAFSNEGMSKGTYYSRRGLVCTTYGEIYAGDFPKPVRIDAQPAHSNKNIWDAFNGTFINDPRLEGALDDKTLVRQRLAEHGIRLPRTHIADAAGDDLQLYHTIAAEMSEGKAVVAKPISESLGRGVIMADPARDSVTSILDKLEAQHHSSPDWRYTLEEWVKSYPLSHEVTHVPLDWNIRSYLASGTTVGSYARVDIWGNAVNISRGAVPKSIEAVLAQCGLARAEQYAVLADLDELNDKIANIFPAARILGPDTIIPKNLKPTVIEVNGERSGGTPNIVATQGSIAPAQTAIRGLHYSLFSTWSAPRTRRPRKLDSLVTAENLLDGVQLLNIGTCPETTLKLIYALPTICEHLPQPLQDQAKEYQKPFSYFIDPDKQASEEDAARNFVIAVVETQRRLHDGEHGAFAPINAWVNSDPDDISRQRRGAEGVMQSLQIDQPKTMLEATLYMPAQTDENAKALSRALLFSLLASEGREINMLRKETIASLLDAGTKFYTQSPENRKFDWAPGAQPIDAETKVVQNMLAHVDLFSALARDDYQTIMGIVVTQLKAPDPHIELFVCLSEYFESFSNLSEQHAFIYCMSELISGELGTAYRIKKTLPPDLQQHAQKQITTYCEDIITETGLTPDDPRHKTTIQRLLTIAELIADEKPQLAEEQLTKIYAEIFEYLTHRLDTTTFTLHTDIEKLFDQQAKQSE